jgi:NIPSNAP
MKNIQFLVFFLLWVGINNTQAQSSTNTDTRVFELRTYYTEPGKLDALIKRFKKHTTKIFEQHGMQNIGYWLPIDNAKNQLIYVLSYPNMEAREAAWKAFAADPTWQKVQRRSERNGKIVNKVESVFMKATDFSPIVAASKQGNRVFELRIYTLMPDKLDAICTRFREHTMTLFAKHGATNLPYWTTIEKDATQQPKLIYFLAHASEAAGKETFKNFVNDPEWKKVQGESEKNGKIVEKIESIYMNALPFSEIR